MAGPLRITYAGALYHVTARGNERRPIFRDAADRERFLERVAAVASRYRVVIHAYVLMRNHYHLLVETPDGNLSAALRQLNGVYTQDFNRRHRTRATGSALEVGNRQTERTRPYRSTPLSARYTR